MGNAVAAAPTLAEFEGAWRLTRRIDDMLAGETWDFAGRARFDPVAGGLDYLETGTLRGPGGRSLRAERRYLWRASAGGVDVLFGDGRFFHSMPVGEDRPEAEHLCGADLYQARYDFADWPRWQAAWRVLGPRKDYLLHSSYER